MLHTLQAKYRHCGFRLSEYLRSEPETMGVKRYISFPAVRNQSRMTPSLFAQKYAKGSFILKTAHHVTVVEDGVLIDTWDCSRKCVYGAWEMKVQKGHNGQSVGSGFIGSNSDSGNASGNASGSCSVIRSSSENFLVRRVSGFCFRLC
jgi:hypothetical protein